MIKTGKKRKKKKKKKKQGGGDHWSGCDGRRRLRKSPVIVVAVVRVGSGAEHALSPLFGPRQRTLLARPLRPLPPVLSLFPLPALVAIVALFPSVDARTSPVRLCSSLPRFNSFIINSIKKIFFFFLRKSKFFFLLGILISDWLIDEHIEIVAWFSAVDDGDWCVRKCCGYCGIRGFELAGCCDLWCLVFGEWLADVSANVFDRPMPKRRPSRHSRLLLRSA